MMRVTFHNATLAARDEAREFKDVLYAAFSEQQELLLDGAYYRVKGLLVRLPVDDPPGIDVTVDWIRRDASGDDYC